MQQYPVKDRTGPQTIDSLSKRIIALGAKQTGQFLVDCETHVVVSPQMGGEFIMIFQLNKLIRGIDPPDVIFMMYISRLDSQRIMKTRKKQKLTSMKKRQLIL